MFITDIWFDAERCLEFLLDLQGMETSKEPGFSPKSLGSVSDSSLNLYLGSLDTQCKMQGLLLLWAIKWCRFLGKVDSVGPHLGPWKGFSSVMQDLSGFIFKYVSDVLFIP